MSGLILPGCCSFHSAVFHPPKKQKMPAHYSHSQGQILRTVFYYPACTVVKAFVASIFHWLMHVKSGKEHALWSPVQTRWLGRGKASGALLAGAGGWGREAHLSSWEGIFGPWVLSHIVVKMYFSTWTGTWLKTLLSPNCVPESCALLWIRTIPLQAPACCPAPGDSQRDHMAPSLQWLDWHQWCSYCIPGGYSNPWHALLAVCGVICAVTHPVTCLAAFTNKLLC